MLHLNRISNRTSVHHIQTNHQRELTYQHREYDELDLQIHTFTKRTKKVSTYTQKNLVLQVYFSYFTKEVEMLCELSWSVEYKTSHWNLSSNFYKGRPVDQKCCLYQWSKWHYFEETCVIQGHNPNLAAAFGFVLSTTTDFPSLIACSANLRHFVIVPKVSFKEKQKFELDNASMKLQ